MRRHFLRLVGHRVLAALLVLLAILQILDLLEVTTDILQRKLGVEGVIHYAALRLPTLLQQAAPLAMLAGCLFAFLQMARENTVVALRSTGVSAYQLLTMIAPVAAAVFALHLACVQWLAPHADQALDVWWSRSAPPAPDEPPKAHSFRVGSDIVVAKEDDPSGRRLSAVSIYRRDASGRLVERLRAPRAVYAGDGWRLFDPTFETIAAGQVQAGQAAEIAWRPGPTPSDVRAIFETESVVAPGSANRALAGGVAAHPPPFYRTALQRGWAAPAAAVVMLLLSSPVLLINARHGGAQTIVACLLAGLLFLVADGIFTALGQGGNIPALLGAWAGPAIFAAAGASALIYLEG